MPKTCTYEDCWQHSSMQQTTRQQGPWVFNEQGIKEAKRRSHISTTKQAITQLACGHSLCQSSRSWDMYADRQIQAPQGNSRTVTSSETKCKGQPLRGRSAARLSWCRSPVLSPARQICCFTCSGSMQKERQVFTMKGTCGGMT